MDLHKNETVDAWDRVRRGLTLFMVGLAGAVSVRFLILPVPLFRDPIAPILLGDDGQLLAARVAADQQWRFPDIQTLPVKFQTALLLAEDRRFFWHPGVDPASLTKALISNFSKGRVVRGASTLTMQVVRLSRENPRRTIPEKIIEIILALSLELSSDKQQILSWYASHAPFGGNVVGVEAAAWRYFGRSPQQLSWAESCMLAVLPNNPSLVHLAKNRDRLKRKRDRLLTQLHHMGKLDALELKLAQQEPLPDAPHPFPRWAPHLLDTLFAEQPQTARFHSTLKTDLQKNVAHIVARRSAMLQRQFIANAAAIVINNEDFTVEAYVGNSRLSDMQDSGYAVDIVRRSRSTGSVLKPFLYAAMLENGDLLPSTLVPDLPTQFGNFSPENFDKNFRGAVPAQHALARSLNVPAVRMLQQFGTARFYDVLQRWGMTTLSRPPSDYGLSLILGGAEGTLWDLSFMYANLVLISRGDVDDRGSLMLTPRILKSDVSRQSSISDIGPGSAWLTLKALMEVARPDEEGFWKQFASSSHIAWKTGTSFGQRDGWAIGSDDRHTVGVWVGNASGEGRADLTGIGAAAPILFDIFSALGSKSTFHQPEGFLVPTAVCQDDGYLPFADCITKEELSPAASHFDRLSPYHQIVHLDKQKKWRVHGRCESVNNMVSESWFTLPPGQEYFYRRLHSDYHLLPDYRPDCVEEAPSKNGRGPMEFLYPSVDGLKIYIPVDLGQKAGLTVFKVAHRAEDSVLFWHLDDNYLGTTRHFHEKALAIPPGPHRLMVVDHQGQTLTRTFEILAKSRQGK